MPAIRRTLAAGALGLAACTFGSTGGSAGATPGGTTGTDGAPTSAGPTSASSGAGTSGAVAESGGGPSGTTTGGPAVDTTAGTVATDGSASSTGEPPSFVLCDPADPELRACYDFVGAGSGTLQDLSGYGNDGTVAAGVVVSPGPFGEVVRVSASAQILVPDDPSLDILAPGLSFDAWVRFDSMPPAGDRYGVFDDNAQYSMFVYEAEGLRCGLGERNVYAPAPPVGTWVHLACVGSAAGSAVYIDGVQVATADPPIDAEPWNTDALVIGDDSPSPVDTLDGEIAAQRIFSRALSPAEIAAAAASLR